MTWARIVSLLPVAAVAALRRVERRVLARFGDAGATTPARAILPEEGGVLLTFVHARFRRAGILRPGADDRYYFDAAAYEAFRRRRRLRAAIVIAAVAGAAVLLFFLGVIR